MSSLKLLFFYLISQLTHCRSGFRSAGNIEHSPGRTCTRLQTKQFVGVYWGKKAHCRPFLNAHKWRRLLFLFLARTAQKIPSVHVLRSGKEIGTVISKMAVQRRPCKSRQNVLRRKSVPIKKHGDENSTPSLHTHRCATALNLSLPPPPPSLLFYKCFLLVLNPCLVRFSTYRSRLSPPHSTRNRRKSVSPPSWNFSIIPDCASPSCALFGGNNCHGEKHDYSGA